jgi:dipeptide/tripeptide permease
MWETVKNYFSEFKILKQTPREFWTLNLVINFFEMLAYFSFITILTLYLTDNLGLNDQEAGNTMGYFTLLITVIIFFSGFIIDSIGVKKALLISMGILIPARLILGLAGTVDTWNLENTLDFDKVGQVISERNLNEMAFTESEGKFLGAQIDLIKEAGVYPEAPAEGDPTAKGYTPIDALGDEPQKLRDYWLQAAAKSPVIAAQWGSDIAEAEKGAAPAEKSLGEASKNQETFKKMVSLMVGEKPDLRQKYFISIDKSLLPESRQANVISVVRIYPELRPQEQVTGFMKDFGSAVSWLKPIGLFKHFPNYAFLDILLVFMNLLLIVTAFGEALMVPAIYAALRQYTNKRTSGTAFNFQYLTMNIGAVLSFAIFDTLRNNLGNESILLFGSAMAVICTVATLFLRANVKIDDEGVVTEEPAKTKEEREMPWAIAASVVKEGAFWRFMLFILLLIGVRLTFTHQFLVFPKYYTRVLGYDAPIGLMNTINPTIIVIGLILFIPVIMRFSVFRLIIVGTMVSALSVFMLVIPGKFFTILGWSIREGYLFIALAQVVIFSFGELIWSPRLSEYTVTIAPKGREGSYMSMAALPMFIAKPLNGWLSGRLLTEYCPKGVMNDIVSGARTWYNGPEMMWLIFGTIALSSPILVLLLKRVIKPDNNGASGDAEPKEAEAA